MPIPPLRPGRRIDGIAAVLLPFGADDRPDWPTYRALVERTYAAGLTPAVNMDTGYVNLLSRGERERVLAEASEVAGRRAFVAGAYIEGEAGEPAALYRREVDDDPRPGRHADPLPVLGPRPGERGGAAGGLPAGGRSRRPAARVRAVAGVRAFGRIPSLEFFRGLLDVPAFVGLKHSSLDREREWERLALRDRHRPGFKAVHGERPRHRHGVLRQRLPPRPRRVRGGGVRRARPPVGRGGRAGVRGQRRRCRRSGPWPSAPPCPPTSTRRRSSCACAG